MPFPPANLCLVFPTQVVGFDFSSAFIRAANDMKANGRADYKYIVEGANLETRTGVRMRACVCMSLYVYVYVHACELVIVFFVLVF